MVKSLCELWSQTALDLDRPRTPARQGKDQVNLSAARGAVKTGGCILRCGMDGMGRLSPSDCGWFRYRPQDRLVPRQESRRRLRRKQKKPIKPRLAPFSRAAGDWVGEQQNRGRAPFPCVVVMQSPFRVVNPIPVLSRFFRASLITSNTGFK